MKKELKLRQLIMYCQERDQETAIHCEQYLLLDTVEAQKQALLDALKYKKPIVIYANEVVQADTAALQLLLSFAETARSQTLHWEWSKPSSALIQIASVLGMRELLHLPEK